MLPSWASPRRSLETSVKYLAVDLGHDNIRINGARPAPSRLLAARGIGGFNYILKWNELNSPLKRTVSIEDVVARGYTCCRICRPA